MWRFRLSGRWKPEKTPKKSAPNLCKTPAPRSCLRMHHWFSCGDVIFQVVQCLCSVNNNLFCFSSVVCPGPSVDLLAHWLVGLSLHPFISWSIRPNDFLQFVCFVILFEVSDKMRGQQIEQAREKNKTKLKMNRMNEQKSSDNWVRSRTKQKRPNKKLEGPAQNNPQRWF